MSYLAMAKQVLRQLKQSEPSGTVAGIASVSPGTATCDPDAAAVITCTLPPDLADACPVPADATIVLADSGGHIGSDMRGPAYMWTWIHGLRWFYVADYPIPYSARR
jgi:hypothetical protein